MFPSSLMPPAHPSLMPQTSSPVHQVFNAHDFTKHEIVLTSYEAIRKDFSRKPDDEDPSAARTMRNKTRRYEIISTEL